ncbi:MAG: tRNA lysidine(34) synthetase TilS [Coriobacteriia bacterium]|jgi:tRNA(Ile)-lysidine synthase|nr:tRNA lysidine(34) synthetase TilS [Coriobacteriia bacterium]
MNEIIDTARATVTAHEMLPPGSPVVVMVSGGADSVALLRLLAEGHLGEGLHLGVLHINHELRGVEADRDEQFVIAECERLGVACRAMRFDVAGYAAAEGLNLEDAGRRVRYRFADEEADARAAMFDVHPPIARIAVAHTLDDRIETFVMRLLRGAGMGGLASIRPIRGRVVRPLIDVSRDDVQAWLSAQPHGEWREDATNLDTSRLRARVRHEVVPALLVVEPALRSTLARTMRLLSDEDELLDAMAHAFAHDFAATPTHPADEVALERTMMATLSRAMQRRTVRAALEDTFPDISPLDSEHVEAIVEGMAEESFARDLPEGLRAFSEYGKIVISHSDKHLPGVAPSLLPIPGSVDLGIYGSIEAALAAGGEASRERFSVVIDAHSATAFTVGPVREGERMRPLGMGGSKKLSDLLTDEKVPRRVRAGVPVVRDGDSVVWVAGVRMSDEYKVQPHTTRPVRLTWRTGPTGCCSRHNGQEL